MAMATDLISGLNPQQREAVTAGDGPVLVLAGPGSGKTRVLTHRIAYLIRERGLPDPRLLAVTFTNKAAAEMRNRVENLLGWRLGGMQIGTFHAICARLLRIEAEHTPYNRDYVIFDTDDQLNIMKQVLAELNVDTKKYSPGRILNAISALKNELITPQRHRGNDYFGEVVSRAYSRYQSLLLDSNAMDFDDLLMQTVFLLRESDPVREKYQQRFEHVLVDEFQDTNQAQYQLVKLFAAPQNNVLVVGDEDQGIYAFRGADYRNVMQFRADYPQARVILLEQNYRSTQVVLDTARAIIDRNTHRTPKALFTDREGGALVTLHEAYDDNDEGTYITQQIEKLMRSKKYRYSDFAIMYRINAQSQALEAALNKARIPNRLVGGVRFFGRRENKDILAYLRVIYNPNDEYSLTRVINVPGRGIGEKSLATFQMWRQTQGYSYSQALAAIKRGEQIPLTGRAAKGLTEFANLIADLHDLTLMNDPVAVFDEVIARTGYRLYLNEISDTTEQLTERDENLQRFRALIAEKKDLDFGDLLADLALVADVDTQDESSDAVTLLTLHAAKGLEFPVVFITGLEDKILPHSRAYDDPDQMAEERRLFYVGVTRAKDHLFLTYTFRRALYGESMVSKPSDFLADIPAELLEGSPAKVRSLRDREGYRKMTSWDVDPSVERVAPPSSYSSTMRERSKVIPFPGRGKPMKYQAGMRVMHPKLGEGIVISSKPSNDDEEVEVRFEKFGIKRLLASFANLLILG
jgi:DNA helicase-2/ATP-dependent DNA helicase PcrA